MAEKHKNFIIMAFLLGVACLFSLNLLFNDVKEIDTVDIKNFPRVIGAWTSEEIPLSKDDLDILETDNAFIRKYTNSNGEAVYLYIVYSQTNRKVSHPPEICYTGSGVSILENVHDQIHMEYKNLTINANRLLLTKDKYYQITYYWFKVGDAFTANYWKQQMLVAINSLLGKDTGSALIRISADINNNDKETAVKEVKEFTALMAPQLFKYLP